MIFNFKNIIGKIGALIKIDRKDSPNEKTKTAVKDSDVRGDVVGRDKNEFNNGNITQISNLEKRVLKVLYLKHQKDHSHPREKISEVYKILKIKDGDWVAPLNDSKYLKIDSEFIVMNADGLRYMDNLEPSDLSKIILPGKNENWNKVTYQQNRMFEENRKNRRINSAR
jgi:hypothetical protein